MLLINSKKSAIYGAGLLAIICAILLQFPCLIDAFIYASVLLTGWVVIASLFVQNVSSFSRYMNITTILVLLLTCIQASLLVSSSPGNVSEIIISVESFLVRGDLAAAWKSFLYLIVLPTALTATALKIGVRKAAIMAENAGSDQQAYSASPVPSPFQTFLKFLGWGFAVNIGLLSGTFAKWYWIGLEYFPPLVSAQAASLATMARGEIFLSLYTLTALAAGITVARQNNNKKASKVMGFCFLGVSVILSLIAIVPGFPIAAFFVLVNLVCLFGFTLWLFLEY